MERIKNLNNLGYFDLHICDDDDKDNLLIGINPYIRDSYAYLNYADYGSPLDKRIIVIFFVKKEYKNQFEYPQPTHIGKWVKIGDCLNYTNDKFILSEFNKYIEEPICNINNVGIKEELVSINGKIRKIEEKELKKDLLYNLLADKLEEFLDIIKDIEKN